jgi:hypothetical protein
VTPDEIFGALVAECHEDHVGLWRIVRAVRDDLEVADPAQARALSLWLVRRLLDEFGMLVGHPTPDGRRFIAWNLPPEQAVRRIEQEWAALGREPDIGEIAWFTSAKEPVGERL